MNLLDRACQSIFQEVAADHFKCWFCECAGALLSRRVQTTKQALNCSVFHMSYFVLSSVCQSCSAPISFMDSRAAGWVGRGRREAAAGDDGISLFDLI